MTSKLSNDGILLPLDPTKILFTHTVLSDRADEATYLHTQHSFILPLGSCRRVFIYNPLSPLMIPLHSRPNLHYIVPTMLSIIPFDFPYFCFKTLFSSAYLVLFFRYFPLSVSPPLQLWKVHSHSSTVTQGPSPSWQTMLVFFQLTQAPVHYSFGKP